MNAPLEWQDATREIKRRVSVREVLERAGVKLRPRHRADCPLPDCRGDRNATLHYKPRDEIWHCFRCDKGGDVFSLVEELQGCDFKRAQKYLAALARVELPAGAKMTRWERQRLAQEQAEHGRKREKVDSTSDDLEQMERRERAECCRLLHFCDDVVNLPGRWTEAQ